MKNLLLLLILSSAGLLVSCAAGPEQKNIPLSMQRFSSPQKNTELWKGTVKNVSGGVLVFHGKKESPVSWFEWYRNKDRKMNLPAGGFVKNPAAGDLVLVRIRREQGNLPVIQGIGVCVKGKKGISFTAIGRNSHYQDLRRELASAKTELDAAKSLYEYAVRCGLNGDLSAAEKFFADALVSFQRLEKQRTAPLFHALALQKWIEVRLEQNKFNTEGLLSALDGFNSIPDYDRYAVFSSELPPDVAAFAGAETFFGKCSAAEQKCFADLLFKRIEMRHAALNRNRLPEAYSYNQALKWYQTAAENGDPEAQRISAEWNNPFFRLLMKMSW